MSESELRRTAVEAFGWTELRAEQLAGGEVLERLGHPPVLALTATASGPVRTGSSCCSTTSAKTLSLAAVRDNGALVPL